MNTMIPTELKGQPPAKRARIDRMSLLLKKSDIWINILSFVGPGHFIFVAGVSREIKELYKAYFSTLKESEIPSVRQEEPQQGKARSKATTTSTFYSAAFSSVSCAGFWENDTTKENHRHQKQNLLPNDKICATIAKSGNLEVLEWAHQKQKEYPKDWNRICAVAARFGHPDILWYANQKNGCRWNEDISQQAAAGGHLRVLQFLHSNGCPWDEWTCMEAASHGHLALLKYAHDNGCPWNKYTCAAAAKEGHLNILQYAHQHGCPWDADTCAKAAEHGWLNILRYAHENGCSWDQRTCLYAAENRHKEVLQYARDNDCPSNGMPRMTNNGLLI